MSLPVYQSHKRVQAAQIRAMVADREGAHAKGPVEKLTIYHDGGSDPIELTGPVAERFFAAFEANAASVGNRDDLGYYVLYPDGYVSWSPTKAFEEGYTHALSPDTYRSKSKCRAWLNTLGSGEEVPAWVLASPDLQFNTPEPGSITVENVWIGTHVCKPGDWLCLADDGAIAACNAGAFQLSYEPCT